MAFDVSSACVGFWKLNENEASATVSDSSSSGFNGTAKNTLGDINTDTIDATGKLNGAFTFDGATNNVHVDMGDVLDQAYNAAISVEAWIKTSTTVEQTIVAKYNSTVSKGWLFEMDGEDLVFFYRDNESNYNYFYLTGIDITDDAWHHVVGTYNGTPGSADSVEFYVDGTHSDAQIAASGTVDSTYDGADPFCIGVRKTNLGVLSAPWTGLIDNVRVYNRVLTQDEVTGLYNDGSGTEALSSTVFKKTLSGIGTGVGKRQMVGV